MRPVPLIICLVLVAASPIPQTFIPVENPVPNSIEKNSRQLLQTQGVIFQGNEEEVPMEPLSLAVDEGENIYVFDQLQLKIFKYSPQLKRIKSFGGIGKGPGKFKPGGEMFTPGYLFIKGDLLYCGVHSNARIACFDTNGKFRYEIKLPESGEVEILPVVDSSGRIYLHGRDRQPEGAFIDLYDEKGEKICGIQSPPNLFRTLRMESARRMYARSRAASFLFCLNSRNQLLVFSALSGYFWTFEGDELQTTRRLWPKRALADYFNRVQSGKTVPFFHKLFVDPVDPAFFFLEYGKFDGGHYHFLYQFETSGTLRRVLYVEHSPNPFISFQCKRNHKYYAITRDKRGLPGIALFQESERE